MQGETKHLTGRVSKRQIDRLDKISRQENTDRSSTLRKILEIGMNEYAKRKAIEEYREGRISVGKAAEESGLSIAEFYMILEKENVPVRIDLESLKG
jgi:predicted HTH domain antitoxin